jgi:hypothetical protein
MLDEKAGDSYKPAEEVPKKRKGLVVTGNKSAPELSPGGG